MAIEIVQGEYGMVLTINISGINLDDFKATEAQTALYIEKENSTSIITSSFAIEEVDNKATGNVSWEVPKTATVGSSAPLLNAGTYRCQLEFINVTRSNIVTATKISKTEVFDVVVKRGL